MNIQINADYRLTSDSLNVIVNRKHIVDPTKAPNWPKRQAEGADSTPKEAWREVAYCATVEKALQYIADQMIRDSEAETVAELLHEIRRIYGEIKAVTAR
jgi:hypothetical protein